jgi:hypothetical protein
MSAHWLMEFMRCPLIYKLKREGKIAARESRAFDFGRAIHTYILEGELAFNEQYAVGGPINPKTGRPYGTETKAFEAWAAEIGKPVVSDTDFQLIEAMADAVNHNETAAQLILQCSAEVTVTGTIHGVECRGRVDGHVEASSLFDLKTCDSLDEFEKQAIRYQYPLQLAFYRALLSQTYGVDKPSMACYLIAVEKSQPYRCGTWKLANILLSHEDEHIRDALEQYKDCMANNVWPSGFEVTRVLEG